MLNYLEWAKSMNLTGWDPTAEYEKWLLARKEENLSSQCCLALREMSRYLPEFPLSISVHHVDSFSDNHPLYDKDAIFSIRWNVGKPNSFVRFVYNKENKELEVLSDFKEWCGNEFSRFVALLYESQWHNTRDSFWGSIDRGI